MKLSKSISNKSNSFSNNFEEKDEDIFEPLVEMSILPPFAEILDELKGLEEVKKNLDFVFFHLKIKDLDNETAFEKTDSQRRELKRKSEGETSVAKKRKPVRTLISFLCGKNYYFLEHF